MESLSKDSLNNILDKIDFNDIALLSQTSIQMNNNVDKYPSMQNGTLYLGTKKLDSNTALVLAANDNDSKLVKYLVKNKRANEWKKACENTQNQEIIEYLYSTFSPIATDRLNIRKWNAEKKLRRNHNSICVIGKQGCGSTSLVKDLIRTIQKTNNFNTKFAMCGGQNEIHEYSDIVEDIFCYNSFNENTFGTFWDKQKRRVRKRGPGHPSNKSLFILDDCHQMRKVWENRNITDMMMNMRHYDTTFINSMQYPMGIRPSLRTCFDYILILRETNISTKKKLFDHYCGIFPTFNMFCTVLDSITEDYRCLVVDNRCHSSAIEDNIFWYKANVNQ